METIPVSEKLARRREQVKKAVRKWRKLHKSKYNAYTREYLKRPEAHKAHLARCKRYRDRKRLERVQLEMQTSLVPSLKIEEESSSRCGPMVLVPCQLS